VIECSLQQEKIVQNPDKAIEQYQLAKKDRERLERMRHIGRRMPGPLTCDDGTRWHPTEILALVEDVERLQADAASRDVEIAMWIERVNSWTRDCERLAEERDQLRAELVKALAACKVKDEALRAANHSCVEDWPLLREALAIQPDDAALKAWLGAPVAWEFTDAFGTHYTDDQRDWMDTPGIESVTPLYSPKGEE
jgi:hypothetical protein